MLQAIAVSLLSGRPVAGYLSFLGDISSLHIYPVAGSLGTVEQKVLTLLHKAQCRPSV